MVKPIPVSTQYYIAVSVGEVHVNSEKWGQITLEEFEKRGGVITFATNKEKK